MLVLCSPFPTLNPVESCGAVVLRGRVEERAGGSAVAFVLRERLLFDKTGWLMRMGCGSVARRAKDIGHHLGRCDSHHRNAWGCVGHPVCYGVGLRWNKRWLHGRHHTHRHRLRSNEGADWEGWCWLGSCWRRLEEWLWGWGWGWLLLGSDSLWDLFQPAVCLWGSTSVVSLERTWWGRTWGGAAPFSAWEGKRGELINVSKSSPFNQLERLEDVHKDRQASSLHRTDCHQHWKHLYASTVLFCYRTTLVKRGGIFYYYFFNSRDLRLQGVQESATCTQNWGAMV